VQNNFITIINDKWSELQARDPLGHVSGALYVVVRRDALYPDDWTPFEKFSELVGQEYRKFLLIKCVETIAENNIDNGTNNNDNGISIRLWKEAKCPPSKMVHSFWQDFAETVDMYHGVPDQEQYL
jgi:hypothetical protein